ncbi:phosphosulfolactate synthase [Paenibacillus glycanilyticus]|uniref:Phosphosulfolactate synthase n=1 Tax=Paenibacillus glycanilyticus TaxID=126569 RepID=A0ABQ6GEM5_9BACL|nr:phosphosulfolactate synthase [Paenibacillus glycanilyticus]GLX69102.1 phosphosulfolactate synthase [Paenibacillus glycanilyticus]
MTTASKAVWHRTLHDPSGYRDYGPASQKGKTMVIDKGIGLGSFADFLQVAGRYVDVIKLGFGTAVLYEPEFLKSKIELAKKSGIIIMPGGTLLETAVQQRLAASFFDTICELGFNGIEVSDGTIELGRNQRTELIKEGKQRGLLVLTEYGKKSAGSLIDPEELAVTADYDLAAGAAWVTVEARESGLDVGLFDEKGNCREQTIEQILAEMTSQDCLMWEAPLKQQQAYLLQQFGPNVHLGNIQPSDALALEAMRRGLRSDTFEFGMREEPAHYMI